jgi:hypothetical protein
MKMQALALGAALGFFAAIAPSCGPTQCTAANCGGCCKDNKCVAKPDNSLNTTCGTSGGACQDCAALNTTCDATTFTCNVTGTGGGGAGGGGAGGSAVCDGCKLANGLCQPRGSSRQNNNICGSNGETCKSCMAPTATCDNGVCIAPPKAVGDGCQMDADCQATLGPTAICKQQSLAGSITYPGGFCTIPSSCPQTPCPMDSVCLSLPRFFGEEASYCAKANCGAANTQGMCRSGWTCVGVGGGNTACLPTPVTTGMFDPDVIEILGNPCTNNSQCRAPTPGAPGAGGFCSPEYLQLPDGGPRLLPDGGFRYTGNPGGQCLRDCRIDEDCTGDATEDLAAGICLPVSQTASTCLKGCNGPIQGQSNCRDGYICESLTQNDGGQLPTGYCDNRCDVPGATCGNYADGGRRICFPNGYCDFGGGRQDAGPPPVIDAGVPDAGTDDGGAAGGAAGGGSAGGGSAGGSTAGGSAGGSTAGGSAGGSTAGGSAGGSATCPDGGAVQSDGGC